MRSCRLGKPFVELSSPSTRICTWLRLHTSKLKYLKVPLNQRSHDFSQDFGLIVTAQSGSQIAIPDERPRVYVFFEGVGPPLQVSLWFSSEVPRLGPPFSETFIICFVILETSSLPYPPQMWSSKGLSGFGWKTTLRTKPECGVAVCP